MKNQKNQTNRCDTRTSVREKKTQDVRPANGRLFVVATPIGNLQDISPHALEVLRQVAWIACEDTRHSAQLFKHYGITTPLKSLHEHNEKQRIQSITNTLQQGLDVALISDAGTPLISDPGYHLVNHLSQAGFRLCPVPGCCALIAALSCAGLATDQFLFSGFLPAQQSARKTALTKRLHETATQIFYEAPHRLLDCLTDLVCVYGAARRAVVARELTKTYENFQYGTLLELQTYYHNHDTQQRGEIVIMVAGNAEEKSDLTEATRVLEILLKVLPVKTAVATAAELTTLRKNDLYKIALAQR
jgi:16S rRNA (cytidine1402-2'-O)-methyltransferase